jgi:hypothetical protein
MGLTLPLSLSLLYYADGMIDNDAPRLTTG